MKKIFIVLNLFMMLDARFQFSYLTDEYATHQPVLYEIVMCTSGPIIEFGCGNGSTPLLHEICKKAGRLLVSIDDNLDWLSKFSISYLGDGYFPDNSGWHKFFYVPGKKNNIDPAHWINFLDSCKLLQVSEFDVCFVDQSPWLARYETIKRFKNKAKYVILHDCNFFPENGVFGKVVKPLIKNMRVPGVFDFSDMFLFFKVYFPSQPWPGPTGPPTLVGSNFSADLPEIDYNKFACDF